MSLETTGDEKEESGVFCNEAILRKISQQRTSARGGTDAVWLWDSASDRADARLERAKMMLK